MASGRTIGSRLTGFRLRPLSRLLLICWLAPWVNAVASGPMVIVDPAQSRVEISVKSTIDSFVAELRDFDAAINVPAQPGQVEAAVFRFNFAAIKTGKPDRDSDMNEWQQTAKFPEVVFTLAALEPVAGGKSLARGQLRFHGVERSVSIPVSIGREKTDFTVDGDVVIDTRDYGLPVIRKFLVLKVDPVVSVHFHLQGKVAGL
jgi:polyisoprenoid-binding protein YceI